MTMLSHPDYAVEDITLVDGNVVILHFLWYNVEQMYCTYCSLHYSVIINIIL
jgi:hypothetical protein